MAATLVAIMRTQMTTDEVRSLHSPSSTQATVPRDSWKTGRHRTAALERGRPARGLDRNCSWSSSFSISFGQLVTTKTSQLGPFAATNERPR